MSAGLLRSKGLQHPFRGVRSLGLDLDVPAEACRAYAACMPPGAVFSHSTAALLWGMPMPLAREKQLHVTVAVGQRAPRARAVVGHQQCLRAGERVTTNGLSVTSPAATWAQLAELLSLEDLIAVAEHIVTGNPYEKRLPLAEVADLEAALAVRSGGAGHRSRVAALIEARVGAFSRPETFVRLLLVRCGVPHPAINEDVYDKLGRFVAMPDLQWPEFRVALEYQGDHHRSTKQFRRDISRLEKLVDADWLVVQVTAAELYGDPRVIVERVARRLASRGWSGRIDLHHVVEFQR